MCWSAVKNLLTHSHSPTVHPQLSLLTILQMTEFTKMSTRKGPTQDILFYAVKTNNSYVTATTYNKYVWQWWRTNSISTVATSGYLCVPSYTASINCFSTLKFITAHLVTSVGTLLNAFSSSTKANWRAPWKNWTSRYISLFHPSLNDVLFPMFCSLVEGSVRF